MDTRTGIFDFSGSGKDLIELYEKRTSLSGATGTTHYVSHTYGKDLGSIFIMNANLGGLGLAGTVGSNCGHKLLNGTDIGSMFCVKRTVVPFLTTFTPLTTSGCWIWLDAGDSTKITQTSNAVSAWTDKSTNVYSFTQATAGNQPAYVANSLNGQSTFLFNRGSSQYLLGPNPANANNFTVGTNSFSLFLVFKYTNTNNPASGGESIFAKSLFAGQTGRIICSRENTGLFFDLIDETNASTLVGRIQIIDSNWQILELVVNRVAGNSNVYKNGTSIASSSFTSNISTNLTNPNYMFVGAYNNNVVGSSTPQSDYFFSGNIAEIVGFSNSSDMSSTTRQNIEGYLARKWGLQTLLPKDHPSLTVLNGSFSQTITGTSFLNTTANQINYWTHNADNSTNSFGILTTTDATYVDGTSTTAPYVALPGITQLLMSRIQTTTVAVSHFIKQTVTIPSEGMYTLSFYHAGRINNYSTNHTLKVDLGTLNIVSGLATTTDITANVANVGWQLFTRTVYFSGDDVGTKDLTLTFTNSSTTATDSAYFITGVVLNYLSPLIGSGLLTSVPTSCSCIYACRWVNNNYFGPILRLRRSTDSITQDFFINSAGTAIGTLPNGTGTSFVSWLGTAPTAYVDTWYDQSGQGNHTLSTGNIADQPPYESSTNSVNCSTGIVKYPVIKDSLGVALAGNTSVSLMCKLAATPTASYPFQFGSSGQGVYTGFYFGNNSYGIESGAGGGSVAKSSVTMAINDVFTAVINTKSNVKIFRSNGSVQKDNASGFFNDFNGLNIAQTSTVANSMNRFLTLKYSAVCVFNTNISDNDRITVSSVI